MRMDSSSESESDSTIVGIIPRLAVGRRWRGNNLEATLGDDCTELEGDSACDIVERWEWLWRQVLLDWNVQILGQIASPKKYNGLPSMSPKEKMSANARLYSFWEFGTRVTIWLAWLLLFILKNRQKEIPVSHFVLWVGSLYVWLKNSIRVSPSVFTLRWTVKHYGKLQGNCVCTAPIFPFFTEQ